MPDLQKINQSLELAIQSLLELKKEINEESMHTQFESQEFKTLREAVQSDEWPSAVNPMLICDPDSLTDIEDRAKGIIELLITEDLIEKKFLDYGCGNGATVNAATEYKTSLSIGYDIENQNWQSKNGSILTSNWLEVEQNKPYDIILLFDVIDHLSGESPTDVLKKIKNVLSENGKIYMRCHPWTSRHGTHLYHNLNKAYLHLIFSPEELQALLPESKNAEPNICVTYPIKTYTSYIEEAGLKIVNRKNTTETVEEFFKEPKIAKRIMNKTKFENFPEFQMSLQFVDFILSK